MKSLSGRVTYLLLKRFRSPFDIRTPLNQQRESMERLSKFYLMPAKVAVERLSINAMAAEWLRPGKMKKDRAVLYLHGGGYTMGSCNTHRALAARIAAASQIPALLIEYRLAPEHVFPAALEDAIEAFHHLLEQGYEPGNIVVAGDSSGGGLAMALLIWLRDQEEPLPAGAVCISPWVDLSLSGETVLTCSNTDPLISLETSLLNASRYVGENDPEAPLISPVFADLSDLPPLLIQVGEYEILRSDSERLSERAQQMGVDVTLETWEGMWHLWQISASYLPEARRAIDHIGVFIREHLD